MEDLNSFVPPHNIEAEMSVLGAMMIESKAIETASGMITKHDFYRDAHRSIFDVIMRLYSRKEPVDIISVTEELKARGLQEHIPMTYITSLFDVVPSAVNVGHYAYIVQEKSLLRRLGDIGRECVAMAHSVVDDVSEVISNSEMLIADLSKRLRAGTKSESFIDIGDRVQQKSEIASLNPQSRRGMTIGYHVFDTMTKGMKRGDIGCILGVSNSGKTGFALSIADHVAVKRGENVLIFEGEMSPDQLFVRMLCSRAEVKSLDYEFGTVGVFERTIVREAFEQIYNDRIRVYKDGRFTPSIIRREGRVMKREQGLELIVVDYLELTQTDKKIENEVQRLDYIIRELKAIALELECVVIVLGQCSNAIHGDTRRNSRQPRAGDHRGSGGIYAALDWDFGIHNPTQWDRRENPDKYMGDPFRTKTEEVDVICLKARNDLAVNWKVGFTPVYTRWVDLSANREVGDTF